MGSNLEIDVYGYVETNHPTLKYMALVAVDKQPRYILILIYRDGSITESFSSFNSAVLELGMESGDIIKQGYRPTYIKLEKRPIHTIQLANFESTQIIEHIQEALDVLDTSAGELDTSAGEWDLT